MGTRRIIAAAAAAFAIDQISKYVVIHMWDLARIRSIDVWPPFVNFRYGENRGINFGLFGGGSDFSRWFLILLATGICLAVLVWARKSNLNRWAEISAGLLIGGAMANVLDRLIYGYVLDFMNNSCCGYTNPFVYNIADVFIFAGAFGLIIFPETPPRKRAKTSRKS